VTIGTGLSDYRHASLRSVTPIPTSRSFRSGIYHRRNPSWCVGDAIAARLCAPSSKLRAPC